MKDATALADHLSKMKAELAARNSAAAVQILRIQDRIETIGYGIDAGEATDDDMAEQDGLLISLKAWKSYKFSLGKVTAQPTWHAAPVWPATPAVPDIDAAPAGRSSELS
ncbi:phage tail protein [Pseudomonas sp. ANT_J12]|uniref:phage tail protein n=1 Tax=Pseudomonas sp. ANT_J12 TaxID=2597351 RepID=UPI0011F1A85C|nr:phage tail protein [Pseudomonas sp. ANT_J12]KAA0995515.1 phage tail protein [Pseudomonas sp. ANT_J12]